MYPKNILLMAGIGVALLVATPSYADDESGGDSAEPGSAMDQGENAEASGSIANDPGNTIEDARSWSSNNFDSTTPDTVDSGNDLQPQPGGMSISPNE